MLQKLNFEIKIKKLLPKQEKEKFRQNLDKTLKIAKNKNGRNPLFLWCAWRDLSWIFALNESPDFACKNFILLAKVLRSLQKIRRTQNPFSSLPEQQNKREVGTSLLFCAWRDSNARPIP